MLQQARRRETTQLEKKMPESRCAHFKYSGRFDEVTGRQLFSNFGMHRIFGLNCISWNMILFGIISCMSNKDQINFLSAKDEYILHIYGVLCDTARGMAWWVCLKDSPQNHVLGEPSLKQILLFSMVVSYPTYKVPYSTFCLCERFC